jgi:hypothetical protein
MVDRPMARLKSPLPVVHACWSSRAAVTGKPVPQAPAASYGEFLVFMDADGADDPSRLPDFLALLNADAADLVLGSRLAGSHAIRRHALAPAQRQLVLGWPDSRFIWCETDGSEPISRRAKATPG